MIEFDDIEKSKQSIDNILKLGEEIIKAAPFLNKEKQMLDLYGKVYSSIPENKESILSSIEGPIQNIQSMNNSNFNMSFVTGSTASFMTAFIETRQTIKSYGSEYYYLINEYESIYKAEAIIENILDSLKSIDSVLHSQFEDAKRTFGEWKVDFKTNSDLAKDIRTFQDTFKGYLNKLRVPKDKWILDDFPEFSWPKMSETIVKKGAGYLKSLKLQQSIHDNSHTKFTVILKKTEEVSKKKMEELFIRYVEHVFAVINLIDENLLK